MEAKDSIAMSEGYDPYKEMIEEGSAELYCDNCGHYPIEPVHGHFVCSNCHVPTKCCEGMALDE